MQQEFPGNLEFDRIADESGLAIAVVDESSREIALSNNNSICRNLNPTGVFTGKCGAFCGTALAETAEVGSSVSFTCHAGLECRAVPIKHLGRPFVAIVGRTFVKAENYRKATERAISGDWSNHSPSKFFENILLTGSLAVLDKTTEKIEAMTGVAKPETPPERKPPVAVSEISKPPVQKPKKAKPEVSNLVERFNRELGLKPNIAKPAQEPEAKEIERAAPIQLAATPPAETKPAQESSDDRVDQARAWRSFFGSLLKSNYAEAIDSILEFIARQHNLSALIWLDKNGNRLENAAAFGEMKGRNIRLGIASDDERLINAQKSEMPLEIDENSKGKVQRQLRTLSLFPIGIGGEISAAIAIFDEIRDEKIKKQIARICQSIAPQIEILRLRKVVNHGETLSTAVRRFSESLKRIDADDLWLNLTQNAAEMLKAERASLLVYDEKAETLEIKAMIGSKSRPDEDDNIGGRVSRIVFEKNKPVSVLDVALTGLPPAPSDRQYKTPSFLSYPISIGSRTIGVMNFTDKVSGLPFDQSSVELFQAIAPQLAIAVDRASLKEKAGEFEQLSVTDPLTGLLNRRYMEERLTEEIKRSNRHGFPMSFMMLDVDKFKSYNDQYGHPAGDEALKLVGVLIRETLRGADVAARFGGEEFSILLPQTTSAEASAIAERIRMGIETADFPERQVTVSIGVASCSAELCTAADIVSAADKALYEAKHRGRNMVLAYEELHLRATG